MKRRYIASIGLTTATVIAAVSMATATYSHGLTANTTPHAVRACSLLTSGHPESRPFPTKQTQTKISSPDVRLTAQVQFSYVCQTYAGPVCGMSVAIPVGAACWCPSYYGPLAGYAR
jgi:hypothetical protein